MNSVVATYGEERHLIEASAIICGDDLVASFVGGERAHVGAVSLAAYEPERHSATVSTLTVYTHRDDHLAALAAKRLSREFACTAVATVGIHMDGAAEHDIRLLCENFEKCLHRLITALVQTIGAKANAAFEDSKE